MYVIIAYKWIISVSILNKQMYVTDMLHLPEMNNVTINSVCLSEICLLKSQPTFKQAHLRTICKFSINQCSHAKSYLMQ